MVNSSSTFAGFIAVIIRSDFPESSRTGVTTIHAPITVHYRSAEVDGVDLFYREAGPAYGPVVLLLHGFPTSSHLSLFSL